MAMNLTLNSVSPRLANFRANHPTVWKLSKSAVASAAIMTAGPIFSDGKQNLDPGLVPSLLIGATIGFSRSGFKLALSALFATLIGGIHDFPYLFPLTTLGTAAVFRNLKPAQPAKVSLIA